MADFKAKTRSTLAKKPQLGKDVPDGQSPITPNGNAKEDEPKPPSKRLTVEEKIGRLTAAMTRLKDCEDLLTDQAAEDFKLINVRFSNVARNEDQKLNLHAIELGIVELCLDVWKRMFELDFMDPKDKAIWNIMYRALSSLWNGSDQYGYICERLLESGAHRYLLEDVIQHKKIVETKGDAANPIQIYTICGALGIIHNMLRHLGESGRGAFRQLNAVEIVRKFLDNKNTMIKAKALIVLAYLINEEENELLNADEIHIKFIVDILREAMESPNRRSKKGFGAIEIIDALNRMAVNDSNKERIHRCGTIILYEKLLKDDLAEMEQVSILLGVWILSFNKKCRDTVNNMPRLQAILKKASSSQNERLKKVANGALWVLEAHKLQKEVIINNSPDTKEAEHVLLSHCVDDRKLVLKIRDGLTEAGFKVCMDENPTGAPLETMAEGVEKAAVVVICISQAYKEDPSCRIEAEYSYQLRKEFLPCRLEAGYKADSWLGIMTATKLAFDFTKKFQPAITSLIKELGDRGRLKKSFELPMVHALVEELGKSKKITSWSSEDVEDWLRQSGLNHMASMWPWMDGGLLQEWKDMRKDAPEFFFQYLKTDLQLPFQDILKLAKALKKV